MKNGQLQSISQNIVKVANVKGGKFAYALVKNSRKIDSELKTIHEAINKLKGIEEYRKAIGEIEKTRDDSVNLLTDENRETETPKLTEKFNKELEKLDEANKELLDEVKKLWDTDTAIEFHKIKEADIPTDITATQLIGLVDLIE